MLKMSKYDETAQQSICLSTKVRCLPCAILHIMIRDKHDDLFNKIVACSENVIAISIPLKHNSNPLFIKFKHYRQTYVNRHLTMESGRSFRCTMNSLVIRRIIVKLPNTYIVNVPLGKVESNIYIFRRCCIEPNINVFDIRDPCFYSHLQSLGIFASPKKMKHYDEQSVSYSGAATGNQEDQRSYLTTPQIPRHICNNYANRSNTLNTNTGYGYILNIQEANGDSHAKNQQYQIISKPTPTIYTRKRGNDDTTVKLEPTIRIPKLEESTQFSTQYQQNSQYTPTVDEKYIPPDQANFPKMETSTDTQSTNVSYLIFDPYTGDHIKTEGSHYNRFIQ